MRVLHVIPSMSPFRGGPSTSILTMTQELARLGVNVEVALTDDDGHGRGRLKVPLGVPRQEDGVTHWYFPRQVQFYSISWPLYAWLATHTREFDLLHIHALFCFPTLAAAVVAGRHGLPYVISPHGSLCRWGLRNRRPWLKRASLSVIESRILQRAACVFYGCEQERAEAEQVGGRGRSVVVPYSSPILNCALDGTVPTRAKWPAVPDVILFLGRLDPIKGLDLLLKGFALLSAKRTGVKLVIAGSGERRFVQGLHELATRLGVAASVTWCGFLQGDDKHAILSTADVFVAPSYFESFGMSTLEAAAYGIPVVVSENVGLQREITEAGAGLAVRCDPSALSEAMLRILESAELRRSMSASGKQLARLHLPCQTTRVLADAYGNILEGHGKSLDITYSRI